MKGVVLAGGHGTRLRPLTLHMNKHVIRVYDRTVIEHSVATLANDGIEDIIVVLNGPFADQVMRVLGDGSQLGCNISYRYQPEIPHGPGRTLLQAESALRGESHFACILGDSLFFSPLAIPRFAPSIFVMPIGAASNEKYTRVKIGTLPGRYHAVDEIGQGEHILTGAFTFPMYVFDIIRSLESSANGASRSELRIRHIIERLVSCGQLLSQKIPAGSFLDGGTFDDLHAAAQYFGQQLVQDMEREREVVNA